MRSSAAVSSGGDGEGAGGLGEVIGGGDASGPTLIS